MGGGGERHAANAGGQPFSIALHILGFLASRGDSPLTSEVLAKTYGTSPVVLRRVPARLQRAGLVETQRGVGGGSVLARDPASINLREAYDAVSDDAPILQRNPGHCSERVGQALSGFVDELFGEAERALLEQLERVTVTQMDNDVRARIARLATRSKSRKRAAMGFEVAVERLSPLYWKPPAGRRRA